MGNEVPRRRVVVLGGDAQEVGRGVHQLREGGAVAAGLVGDDEHLARQMGEEMLGGVDEVVGEAEWRGRRASPSRR